MSQKAKPLSHAIGIPIIRWKSGRAMTMFRAKPLSHKKKMVFSCVQNKNMAENSIKKVPKTEK